MAAPKRQSQSDIRQRLIALAGVAVTVGVALVVLAAVGLLGSRGGGRGIAGVILLDVTRVVNGFIRLPQMEKALADALQSSTGGQSAVPVGTSGPATSPAALPP